MELDPVDWQIMTLAIAMVLYLGSFGSFYSILFIDLLPWLFPTWDIGTHIVVMSKGVQTMGSGLCAPTHTLPFRHQKKSVQRLPL